MRDDCSKRLIENLHANEVNDYESFDKKILRVVNIQAPLKKKVIKANHKPRQKKVKKSKK